jgi:hypothetical protein
MISMTRVTGPPRSTIAIAASIALITLAAGAVAAELPTTPHFIAPPYLLTDNSPQQVVVADFNHDGMMDIAVTTPTSIDVFLAQGNGQFQPYRSYPATTGANAIVVGDVNNDGNVDLIYTIGGGLGRPGGYVKVLLGNGDGTFRVGKALHVAKFANSLALGDFNHDGNLDLAIGHSRTNVGVALGNGKGTFQAETLTNSGDQAGSVVVADFDGDGNLDIAAAGSRVDVLYGNGDGTFPSAQEYGPSSSMLAVTDVNSDGKPDIVTIFHTSSATDLRVLVNQGNRNFAAKSSNTGGLLGPLAVGDFNNDGKVDVAIAGLGIMFGKGNGTFTTPSVFYAGEGNGHLIAADLNGDHKTDVIEVASTYAAGILLIFGNGDGTLQAPRTFATFGGGSLITVADFSNDGNIDVAALTVGQIGQAGNTLLGNGNGTFQPPLQSFYGGGNIASIAHGDFNNDGNMDLVVINGGAPAFIFLGLGNGTFQGSTISGTGGGSRAVIVRDFNGDGNQDLAVADNCVDPPTCATGGVDLLFGIGDGTFQLPVGVPVVAMPTSVVAGDFNKDGLLDIAVCSQGNGVGYVSVLIGNGGGTFQPAMTLNFTGTNPTSIVSADFNGDGILDLAVSDGNGVDVLLGIGNGQFSPAITTSNVFEGILVADDFNGDGITDIAVASAESGLQVLTGIGDGTFLQPLALLQDTGIVSIKTARLGGDQLPDIIVGTTDLLRSVVVVVNATK